MTTTLQRDDVERVRDKLRKLVAKYKKYERGDERSSLQVDEKEVAALRIGINFAGGQVPGDWSKSQKKQERIVAKLKKEADAILFTFLEANGLSLLAHMNDRYVEGTSYRLYGVTNSPRIVVAGAFMNARQEKDIIRTLVKAGHEALAKTFAVSRGYRVRGITLNPKDLFGVEPGPDTRSKLLRRFQDTPKGGKLKLGGVTYLVSSVHGYVEPPPGAPSKLPKPKSGEALSPLHYMIIGHDLARKGEVEKVPGTGNYQNVPYIRTLIIDIPTDTVLVYPWESGQFNAQGIPTRGKPVKVKASLVRGAVKDKGYPRRGKPQKVKANIPHADFYAAVKKGVAKGTGGQLDATVHKLIKKPHGSSMMYEVWVNLNEKSRGQRFGGKMPIYPTFKFYLSDSRTEPALELRVVMVSGGFHPQETELGMWPIKRAGIDSRGYEFHDLNPAIDRIAAIIREHGFDATYVD